MEGVLAPNTCRQIIVHPLFSLPKARPTATRRVEWSHLPLELLDHAAQYLEAQDLCRLALVNRACRAAAGAQHHWHRCFCQKFSGIGSRDPEPSCWKELYRYNHEVLYTVLMYRRPEKLFNLGGGVIYLNLPIGVPV